MPEPVEGSRPYLAGLDGIRAIAVLGVIAFHVSAGWAAGGLLGVGVFFVLSGYLITDLLVAEYRRHRKIDLPQFWLRRARRLLPALFLMLFVVVGWVTLFDRAQLSVVRNDLLSAVAYYSNWWFIYQHVSYFSRFGPPAPLGHLWSLAIEEQFYLIWPMILLAGLRLARRRRPLIVLVVAAAAGSALEMALLYVPFSDPTRVYDGTDTRAFALLIGAALALAWPRDRKIAELTDGARRVLETAGTLAVAGIVILFCATSEYQTFLYRGGMVLCAFLSAVLIAVTIHPGTRFARMLGITPLRWIGKRSYGIYLWSYPVIVLTTPGNKSPGAMRSVIDVAATFGLAGFSWKYIEEPVRQGALCDLWMRVRSSVLPRPSRRVWLIGSFVSAIVVICFAGLTGLVGDPVGPQSSVTAILPTGSSSPPSSRSTTTLPAKSAGSSGSTAETTATTPKRPRGAGILAIGDSIMIDAAPYLRHLLPGIGIDAIEGQQLYQVQAAVPKLREHGVVGDRLVLELGTNGPYSQTQLNNLIRSFGPMEKIVLVNAWVDRPWEQFVNETLAAAAKVHPNVSVVDWFALARSHPQDFYPDGVHLNPRGASYYAGLIATAIESPAPAVPSPTPNETRLLSCAGTAVVKPSTFRLGCGGAYRELTKSRWTSWTRSGASGSTDFGINLCRPTCASARITFFPSSRVRLSGPMATNHGRIFSSVIVHYVRGGKERTFESSRKNRPAL